MIAFGTRAHSETRRRQIPVMEDTFHKGEWMETGEDPRLSPIVFLAEQPPDYQLIPHFHRQNQFQLFVHGSGTIGPHRVDPVTIHYAGAYTGYGPLLSGDEGLKYFTIRAAFDTGLIPVSEARANMVRGPKRHDQAAIGAPWDSAQLAGLREAQQEWPIEPKDGLGAQHARLPAGAAMALQCIAGSCGQFVFVLAGSARVRGHELGVWESVFVTPEERDVAVEAGEGGAEIVCLHMPVTDAAYIA